MLLSNTGFYFKSKVKAGKLLQVEIYKGVTDVIARDA